MRSIVIEVQLVCKKLMLTLFFILCLKQVAQKYVRQFRVSKQRMCLSENLIVLKVLHIITGE